MRTAFVDPTPPRTRIDWAPEQAAALRQVAARDGDIETAVRLTGKSYNAVYHKARRDGLTLRRLVDRRYGPRPPRERVAPHPLPVDEAAIPHVMPIRFGDCAGCGDHRMVNAALICLDCHTPADKGDIQALIEGARAWAAGR